MDIPLNKQNGDINKTIKNVLLDPISLKKIEPMLSPYEKKFKEGLLSNQAKVLENKKITYISNFLTLEFASKYIFGDNNKKEEVFSVLKKLLKIKEIPSFSNSDLTQLNKTSFGTLLFQEMTNSEEKSNSVINYFRENYTLDSIRKANEGFLKTGGLSNSEKEFIYDGIYELLSEDTVSESIGRVFSDKQIDFLFKGNILNISENRQIIRLSNIISDLSWVTNYEGVNDIDLWMVSSPLMNIYEEKDIDIEKFQKDFTKFQRYININYGKLAKGLEKSTPKKDLDLKLISFHKKTLGENLNKIIQNFEKTNNLFQESIKHVKTRQNEFMLQKPINEDYIKGIKRTFSGTFIKILEEHLGISKKSTTFLSEMNYSKRLNQLTENKSILDVDSEEIRNFFYSFDSVSELDIEKNSIKKVLKNKSVELKGTKIIINDYGLLRSSDEKSEVEPYDFKPTGLSNFINLINIISHNRIDGNVKGNTDIVKGNQNNLVKFEKKRTWLNHSLSLSSIATGIPYSLISTDGVKYTITQGQKVTFDFKGNIELLQKIDRELNLSQ